MWCTIKADQLKLTPSARGPLELRSDSSLASDLARFRTIGMGNLDVAKLYNNVIREPLFKISLAQAWNFLYTRYYQSKSPHIQ